MITMDNLKFDFLLSITENCFKIVFVDRVGWISASPLQNSF